MVVVMQGSSSVMVVTTGTMYMRNLLTLEFEFVMFVFDSNKRIKNYLSHFNKWFIRTDTTE